MEILPLEKMNEATLELLIKNATTCINTCDDRRAKQEMIELRHQAQQMLNKKTTKRWKNILKEDY
jgi:hypothetical protein